VSRIGKKPVPIPKGVSVTISGNHVTVRGPRGELSRELPPTIRAEVKGGEVVVERTSGSRRGGAMHGLGRTLIQNMVTGVSQGFTRALEVNGVGYRAEVRGRSLNLVLGYSHPIEVILPESPRVEARVDKNRIELSCIDKEVLGRLAAVIRAQRPPEPYKGKGIRYVEEEIRRKVGKAGAS